jgi:hypothetical protein
MEIYQFLTLVGMLAGGFGWMLIWLKAIDKSVHELDKRVTILETRVGFIERLLEMFARNGKLEFKERTDP